MNDDDANRFVRDLAGDDKDLHALIEAEKARAEKEQEAREERILDRIMALQKRIGRRNTLAARARITRRVDTMHRALYSVPIELDPAEQYQNARAVDAGRIRVKALRKARRQ